MSNSPIASHVLMRPVCEVIAVGRHLFDLRVEDRLVQIIRPGCYQDPMMARRCAEACTSTRRATSSYTGFTAAEGRRPSSAVRRIGSR